MRFVLTLVLTFLCFAGASANPAESNKLALISEFCVNANMGHSMREGIRHWPQTSPAAAEFKAKVGALPEEVLIKLIAENYSERLSHAEAKEVAEFYRSKAGKKLVAIQSSNVTNANPSYAAMSASEIRSAQKFSNSPGTRSFREAGSDPAFFVALAKRIKDYLSAQDKL
jgi:hypothetical protein